MRTVTKTLDKLTDDEYRSLLHLNMRENGMMMYSLVDNKNSPRSYAVMVKSKDRIEGWALMVPIDDECWNATRYQRRHCKFVTQFYVRVPERGKGIGSKVMAGVQKIEPKPLVIPHDGISGAFFANYQVITERDRRDIINEAKKRKRRAA